MNYASEIRAFVVNNFLFGDGASLDDDKSFLDSGVVDSTGMLELITFLESTFGIRIEPEEMLPENLDTVNRAAAFVAKKRTPETAGQKLT